MDIYILMKRRKELLQSNSRDKIIKNFLVLSNGVYYVNEKQLLLKNIIFNTPKKDERVQKFTGVLRKSLQPIEVKVRDWWARTGNKRNNGNSI